MRVKVKGGATRSIDGDDEEGVGWVVWHVKLMARRWKFDNSQQPVACRGITWVRSVHTDKYTDKKGGRLLRDNARSACMACF